MKTDYETLLVKQDGPILEVVINRPDVRNALNFQTVDDLDRILAEAQVDPGVKVMTLTGAGKVFSAGGDIVEAAENFKGTGHLNAVDPHAPPTLRRAWYFTKPLIAGVHGYVGPLANIILGYFDFIIAAEGTRFSFEQMRISAGGLGGEPLGMQLPMRVWKKTQMMGGWFDADQALDFHLVQRVVPVDEVVKETRRWADQLALMPPEVELAKQSIHRQYELMGLVNMQSVQNRSFGHPPTRENLAWWMEAKKSGRLKASIASRNTGFDDEIAKV